jgi:hypothetical protein
MLCLWYVHLLLLLSLTYEHDMLLLMCCSSCHLVDCQAAAAIVLRLLGVYPAAAVVVWLVSSYLH